MNKTDRMIFSYAEAIKDYCNERNCDGCPFCRTADKECVMEFDCPSEWDFDKTYPFKVGDEIRIKGSDPAIDDCDFGVVTYINNREMHLIRSDGSGGSYDDFDNWEKTGRCYSEVESLLRWMNSRYAGFYCDTDSVKEDPDA